jgi:hypothetical protein
MITEKEIPRINSIIEDEIFKIDFGPNNHDIFWVEFKMKIVGIKKMISVGDYYDHVNVLVIVTDTNQNLIKIATMLTDKMGQLKYISDWFIKDYRTLLKFEKEIIEALTYFSDGDRTRVTFKVEYDESFIEKINDFEK